MFQINVHPVCPQNKQLSVGYILCRLIFSYLLVGFGLFRLQPQQQPLPTLMGMSENVKWIHIGQYSHFVWCSVTGSEWLGMTGWQWQETCTSSTWKQHFRFNVLHIYSRLHVSILLFLLFLLFSIYYTLSEICWDKKHCSVGISVHIWNNA